MITDYTSLRAEVANWANRDDLTPNIPTFIQMGENAMYRALRARINEKTVVGTLATASFTLPNDYEEALLLVVDGCPLERVSSQKLLTLKASGLSGAEPARIWARHVANVEIFPAPGSLVEYELTYWGRYPPLTDANPVNGVLDSAPELFLFFALVEVAVFLRDETGGTYWSAQAKRVLDTLNNTWVEEGIAGSTQHINVIGGDYGT